MPRVLHNALTDVEVKALVKRGEPGRHADGQGLYLHVTGAGQAKWSLRYTYGGKAREMGLGAAYRRDGDELVAVVGLAAARKAARAAKAKLDAGIDPVGEREAAEAQKRAAAAEAAARQAAPARTFRAAFQGWLEDHGPAMRTERQRVLVKGLMGRYVLPSIGDKQVGTIGTKDVAAILRPIWRTKAETALRVRIRCEAVLAWAKAHGWREGDNPAAWKGNLEPLLGRQGDVARAKHHAALPWQDVPAFMRRLEAEAGMSALALRFLIVTAARTGEVLGATWDEIDIGASGGPLWVVPASRMKMGVEHRVPLSGAALAVLEAVKDRRQEDAPGGGFLFPGAAGSRGGRIAGGREGAVGGGLSNMALLALLRRLDVAGNVTAHGFRSSFRDWAEECSSAPVAVIEQSLAHAVGSDVERAYRRTDLLEKRRVLMAQWAEHCQREPASVVPLRQVVAADAEAAAG
jgi:integrase